MLCECMKNPFSLSGLLTEVLEGHLPCLQDVPRSNKALASRLQGMAISEISHAGTHLQSCHSAQQGPVSRRAEPPQGHVTYLPIQNTLGSAPPVEEHGAMSMVTLEGELIQVFTEGRPGQGGEMVCILGAFFLQARLLELQTPLRKAPEIYLFYQRKN